MLFRSQAALADARAAFSEIPRSSPDSERLWQELQELIPVVLVPYADQEFAKLRVLIQNSEATIQQRQAALADARAAFSEIPRSSPDSERLWQELQELIPVVEVP